MKLTQEEKSKLVILNGIGVLLTLFIFLLKNIFNRKDFSIIIYNTNNIYYEYYRYYNM